VDLNLSTTFSTPQPSAATSFNRGLWAFYPKAIQPLPAITIFPSVACLAIALASYWLSYPLLLCASIFPALWIGAISPARLVQLLLITTPIFPVIRLVEDVLQSRQVSTKGVFCSADDPLITALILTWIWRWMRHRGNPRKLFPSALLCLILLYPLVIAVNAMRLSPDQVIISALYYLKWIQYAVLLIAIPQVVPAVQVPQLVASFRKLLIVPLAASALFAAYETFESLRTGTFSAAARYPRASSFFGSLNPLMFGASEDPVNFGVYAMVAGSIVLGLWTWTGRKGRGALLVGLISGVASILLCASRAPMLAAALAASKIHRFRSSHVILLLGGAVFLALISLVLAPQIWTVTVERFEAMADWQNAFEHSAQDRATIVSHSPVFQIDQYWIFGHGFFSYRFIAEEHLAAITGGISRSLYNFLLTAWYDAGAFGLALWILLFVQLSRRFRHIHRTCPSLDIRAIAWGLLGALWGLALASMFGEIPYSWRIMGFFYTCSGICLAGDAYYRRIAAIGMERH
jgi:hypothetical protein